MEKQGRERAGNCKSPKGAGHGPREEEICKTSAALPGTRRRLDPRELVSSLRRAETPGFTASEAWKPRPGGSAPPIVADPSRESRRSSRGPPRGGGWSRRRSRTCGRQREEGERSWQTMHARQAQRKGQSTGTPVTRCLLPAQTMLAEEMQVKSAQSTQQVWALQRGTYAGQRAWICRADLVCIRPSTRG